MTYTKHAWLAELITKLLSTQKFKVTILRTHETELKDYNFAFKVFHVGKHNYDCSGSDFWVKVNDIPLGSYYVCSGGILRNSMEAKAPLKGLLNQEALTTWLTQIKQAWSPENEEEQVGPIFIREDEDAPIAFCFQRLRDAEANPMIQLTEGNKIYTMEERGYYAFPAELKTKRDSRYGEPSRLIVLTDNAFFKFKGDTYPMISKAFLKEALIITLRGWFYEQSVLNSSYDLSKVGEATLSCCGVTVSLKQEE
jgi:hypothetical protein